MSSVSAMNDAIFKEFVNLFDKCDSENTNSARKSDLVKIISSSVEAHNPYIEDIVISIIGCNDEEQFMTRNEFIKKIEEYMKSHGEYIEKSNKPRKDIEFQQPPFCSWMRSEKKKLEALCDELTAQIRTIEDRNAKLENEKHQITSSYEKLHAREKELQQVLEELQEDLIKKDERCLHLNRRLTESGEALNREREKSKDLKENLKRQSEDFTMILQNLRTAQKENEQQRKIVVEIEKKLELKEDEYISCNQKLTSLQDNFKDELSKFLKKIDSLEKNEYSLKNEMLNGLNKIEDLTNLNKDLEIKYNMLKCSKTLNNDGNHCDSTLLDFEIDHNSTEGSINLIEDQSKTSTGDSGCHDSLSLRDEMEAEGEIFDKFGTIDLDCGHYDLIDKINNQEKTIDCLTEMISKEKENNKLTSETLDNCKKDFDEARNTIEQLKQEKQKIEEEWRANRIKLEELSNELKKERSKHNVVGRVIAPISDPGIEHNIEHTLHQQMIIHNLIEKFTKKPFKGSSTIQSSLISSNTERFESNPNENNGASAIDVTDLHNVKIGNCILPKEARATNEVTDLHNVKIGNCILPKEVRATNLDNTPQTSKINSNRFINVDNMECGLKGDDIRQKNLNSCLSSHRSANPYMMVYKRESKSFHPSVSGIICVGIGDRSDISAEICKNLMLLFLSLILMLWMSMQWLLMESEIDCLQTPSDSPVIEIICPYVSFKWNESPPF